MPPFPIIFLRFKLLVIFKMIPNLSWELMILEQLDSVRRAALDIVIVNTIQRIGLWQLWKLWQIVKTGLPECSSGKIVVKIVMDCKNCDGLPECSLYTIFLSWPLTRRFARRQGRECQYGKPCPCLEVSGIQGKWTVPFSECCYWQVTS